MKSSMLLTHFDFTTPSERLRWLGTGASIVGEYCEGTGNDKRTWKMVYNCNSGYLLFGACSIEEISPNKLQLLSGNTLQLLSGNILRVFKDKECFYS